MGVAGGVVEWLRANEHDAVHLRERGLIRLPDEQVFDLAFAEGRVLLTFDLDFGEIVALSGNRSTSVVIFRLRNTRTRHVIERLGNVLERSGSELEEGAVIVVEDERHRIRKLPFGKR